MVGGLEIVMAVAVLVAPFPSLLISIGLWKMATEMLFMTAGALPFEWIERAGSYMAPLALSYWGNHMHHEGRGSGTSRLRKIFDPSLIHPHPLNVGL
jgi:hypothetical protein